MRDAIRWISFVATIAFSAILPIGLAAAEEPPPQHRALLIGINEYQVLPNLRGAINDLEIIEQVLITRFGFSVENIEKLTDNDATRERILETMRSFVERCGPRDVVYIHYSGHGSQVKDLDGDEEDGQDETLVPHDGRTPGVPDITDDELAEIFSGLTTASAVIALDSCHSGTATRGVSAFTHRLVPADDRVELYEKLRTRAIVPTPESRYVVLTGAASNQKALDGPVGGKSHGLFSFALAKSLGEAAPGATPIEVFRGIERELERLKGQLGLYNMPEPQLEGPESRLGSSFLAGSDGEEGESAAEPAAHFLATELLETGQFQLVGAHGQAALGSVWALYDDGEVAFEPGGALAELTLVSSSPDGWLANVKAEYEDLPKKGRAILLEPAAPEAVVLVHVEAAAEAAAALQEAIEGQLPEVEFVDAEEDFARFYVELEEEAAVVFGADHEQEVLRIESAEPGKIAVELSRLFSRSMTVTELLSLENPISRIELDVAITRDEETSDAKQGPIVAKARAPEFRARRKDEARTPENSLQLTVRSTQDCYITVIDVDSEGTVSAVFPNALSEAAGYYRGGFLAANEELRIPDSLAPGNQAGFYADFSPPAGIDTLRVFCTSDAETALLIREAVADLSIADRGTVRSMLVGRLRKLLFAGRTRGLRIVAAERPAKTAPEPSAPDWAATSLTLRVIDTAP